MIVRVSKDTVAGVEVRTGQSNEGSSSVETVYVSTDMDPDRSGVRAADYYSYEEGMVTAGAQFLGNAAGKNTKMVTKGTAEASSRAGYVSRWKSG